MKNSLWLALFNFLRTFCWFTTIPVCSTLNWIADHKLRPENHIIEWGIDHWQYRYLPIAPIANLIYCMLMCLPVWFITKNPQITSAVCACLYVLNENLHFDALADTVDSLYASTDKERVMRDPHVGAMALHHVVSHQIMLTATLYFLGTYMLQGLNWVSLIQIFLVLALTRTNVVYIIEKQKKCGKFKEDARVSSKEDSTRYALTLSLVMCIPIYLMSGQWQDVVYPLLSTLLALLITNNTQVKYAIENIGFYSGDMCGYTILKAELLSLVFLTIFFYKV